MSWSQEERIDEYVTNLSMLESFKLILCVFLVRSSFTMSKRRNRIGKLHSRPQS